MRAIQISSKQLIVVLLLLLPSISIAGAIQQLNIGLGAGPQPGGRSLGQSNAVLDFQYYFYEYQFKKYPRWQVLLGGAYSRLATDAGHHSNVDVVSFIPMFRYTISESEKRQWFFQVGAGPSVMSSAQLGNQVQGSRFLFNDWIGVGVKFGEEKDWELNMSWRHLSNANLTPPNPGFDVPFTFTLGRKF